MNEPTVVWHGTRSVGLALARRIGFAVREPARVAAIVADAFDIPIASLMASDEYQDAVGSLTYVREVLSVTGDRRLADRYAQTGSGTVSDILGAAHRLLGERGQQPPDFDQFVMDWLSESEGKPVVVEFRIPRSRLERIAHCEYGIPLSDAPRWATRVWHADGSSEAFAQS